jgi:hypothetical protein
VSDLQRQIRQMRVFRAAFAALAVPHTFMFVADVAAGSFAAVSLVFCVLMIVRNTRRIGTLRARERELNRPRMTPEDYRQLREMELELGWEPSEPDMPARPQPRPLSDSGVVQLADPARLCGQPADGDQCRECEQRLKRTELTATGPFPDTTALSGTGSLSAPMTGPGGHWRPLSELTAENEVRLKATEHFAALARVGRESCIGFCPICAARKEGIA